MDPMLLIILGSKDNVEGCGRWPRRAGEMPTVGASTGKLASGPTSAGTQESAVLTHLGWQVQAI